MSAKAVSLFQIISLLLTAALLGRMALSGLYAKYRWFSGFLLFSLVRFLIPLLPLSRSNYALVWMSTEVVLWGFYFMVLYELYTLVLERFPGIRTMTGWMFLASLAMAVLAAALLGSPVTGGKVSDTLMVFLAAERGVLSALALLVLLMTAFLCWFPVPLPRNLIWHSMLFAAYFLLKAGALLVRNLYGHTATHSLSNTVIPVAGWVCLTLWIGVMRRSGEETLAKAGRRWDQEHEEHLLAQLKGINSSLSRLTR